jgi:RNA-directed DNA polymerase
MPQDAPPDGSAPGPAPEGPWPLVAGMQAELHRWAVADPGRRFDDPFNLRARLGDPAGSRATGARTRPAWTG